MLKIFALLMTIDGTLTAVLGKRYLRWMENHAMWPMTALAHWFMTWPGWLLRGGAAIQAFTSWGTFWRLSNPQWADDKRWFVPSRMEEHETYRH
jgi:hypothetical protein